MRIEIDYRNRKYRNRKCRNRKYTNFSSGLAKTMLSASTSPTIGDTICFAQSDRLAHLFAIFFAKRIIQAYTVAPLKTDLQ